MAVTQLQHVTTPNEKRRHALPLVLGATIVGTLLATARYGVGLTPDSVVYVTGARSLAEGRGYTTGGLAITDFPPGYSATLSVAERIGIDAIDAARILGVIGFVATVLLGYVLLRRHVGSRTVLVAATVLIGCSAVLLDVYQKALSEQLFIPVLLAFALLIEMLARRPRSVVLLAEAVLLVWIAFYLRYIGVVFLAAGAIVTLTAEWRRSRGSAVLRAAIFATLSLVAPVAWMKRNVDAGSDPFGHRVSASASIFTNVARIAKQVSTWLLTDAGPSALRLFVLLVGLAFVAVLLIRLRRDGIDVPADWRSVLPLTILVVTYVVYLVISASFVAFGAISNTRFLVPVFVPSVVLAAWLFERVRERIPREEVRRAITILAGVWIGLNFVWFVSRAVRSAEQGAGGYATARYHNSQIMKDVKRLDSSTLTFSNDIQAVRLFTGREVRPTVAKTFFQSDEQTGKLDDFVQLIGCRGKAELIWFLPNPRPHLYSPAQLSQRLRLHIAVRRSDGVIYDVRSRDSATPRSDGSQCPRA
jgi:hypothetical protein